MELLKSEKFKLPTLYFITDREEIENIPIGIPFIYGDEKHKEYIIRVLEYEILYQKAKSTGLPFDFRKILEDEGYDLNDQYGGFVTAYMDVKTDDHALTTDSELQPFIKDSTPFSEYVKDGTAYIDIQKIKDLKHFPIWLETIEKSVDTNIHHFSIFNPNMYNKKLEGVYGGLEFTSPKRNLLSYDISASIPNSIGTTFMTLAKWMGETFYADIIITGRHTLFVPYEELHNLDIEKVYSTHGNGQECQEYRKLITSSDKEYGTCIAFGDFHSISESWGGIGRISRKDGKKLCKWKINKLISFNKDSNTEITGFAEWFSPDHTEIIKNWTKYLN